MILMVFVVSGFFYLQFVSGNEEPAEDGKLVLAGKAYDLGHPDAEYKLPPVLEEISGISFYENNKVVCVQDEVGEIFIYDLETEEVIRNEPFRKDGDYEGVEVIHDVVYVVSSRGDIYFFPLQKKGIGMVKEIATPLSAGNDVEGLGYSVNDSSLLIATKESGGIDDRRKEDNAVYRILLNSNGFDPQPRVVIDEAEIEELLAAKNFSKKRHLPAKPSALTYFSGKILVLCSVGKLLLIYSDQGKLEDLVPLDEDVFQQPEGLTFDQEGALLISSEGRGGRGYIVKFHPR